MILKGNQRGGGQCSWCRPTCMNSFDNERVEIADVRGGAVADDLSGSFAEWSRRGPRHPVQDKFLYSLSLNPVPGAVGHLTREQYLELLERTERSLQLVDGSPAPSFFTKSETNRACCANTATRSGRASTRRRQMKAVQIAHDRLEAAHGRAGLRPRPRAGIAGRPEAG